MSEETCTCEAPRGTYRCLNCGLPLPEIECDSCAGTGRYGFRDDDECRFCNGSGRVRRATPDQSEGREP